MRKSHKKVEVVLAEKVENLGNVGEKVTVATGYARNFLVMKKMAVTLDNPKAKGLLIKAEEENKAQEKKLKLAQKQIEKLAGTSLEFLKKAGKSKIFGSIKRQDIADMILEKSKIKIVKDQVKLEAPLKSLGEFPVDIELAPDIFATINVIIK
jgi:large subunit ribosomal protein L9